MEEKIKGLVKKWWFWVIVVVLIIGIAGMGAENVDTDTSNNSNETIKYTLTGETLGKYGKKIILNANSDMPTTKYLYKLPEGTYAVTTTFDKLANFYIVKDEIANTGTDEYPEELNYVSEAYFLTNGENNFNGRAKKSVEINVDNDESILIIGTTTFTFEKLN